MSIGASKGTTGETSSVLGDINVTPMVDVMLVLLIIFMVVTPALLTGFQATLPTGINLIERPDDETRVTLGVDRFGNYYLNRRPIDKAMAVQLLTAAFSARPEDKVLFLKADTELEYAQVVEAMLIGRDAGARVLAAVSERPAGYQDPEEGGH